MGGVNGLLFCNLTVPRLSGCSSSTTIVNPSEAGAVVFDVSWFSCCACK